MCIINPCGFLHFFSIKAYPVYATVIETIDVASLAIANLIDSPGTLKSHVKNISKSCSTTEKMQLQQFTNEYIYFHHPVSLHEHDEVGFIYQNRILRS